jgi:TldD protein
VRARAELAARADDPDVQPEPACPATCRSSNLFDDVRDGVYMEANRSWSIDDRRLNFQFGCADRLGDQERQTRPDAQESDLRRRDAGVLEFVRRDRRRGSWFEWGTPNCGKGEPMQTGRTTQAAAPARFRNVAVGVGYGR